MIRIRHHEDHGYFIEIPDIDFIYDSEIAEFLNIDYKDYQIKAITYGAHISDFDDEFYFKNKEDAKDFLEYLIPYMVARKLSDAN
ncbi:MAG: hypothetical protein ACOCP8_01885 [archaeon]